MSPWYVCMRMCLSKNLCICVCNSRSVYMFVPVCVCLRVCKYVSAYVLVGCPLVPSGYNKSLIPVPLERQLMQLPSC